MNEEMIRLPEACARTLDALAADPLSPGAEAEAHLRACAACAEARVMLLAQEEAPVALAPAGYFETLAPRIARKLPASKPRRRLPAWAWGAAAAILVASGVGGYLAGRATPALPTLQPMAQQILPPDAAGQDQTIPFHDRDEDLAELGNLSQSEMKDLVAKLEPAAGKLKRTPK